MKRLLPVLVCCLARAAAAQTPLTAQSSEPPAYEPQTVEMRGDGRCTAVRPGDTVHYTLSIDNVIAARAVYGDLRLRLGHLREVTTRAGLPVPDFRSLGGGGIGERDAADARQYHFTFTVPQEIFGGTYRGVDVYVHAQEKETLNDDPYSAYASPYLRASGERRPVGVTKHTRKEIHAYCLNVMSGFGFQNARAAVVNFEPGAVDPAAPKPVTPGPTPLPPQPLPVPVQPVPQPR